jgi:hypothetical protein
MEINWLAVFVASLSSFVIGAIWFGPKTFYPIWMKALRGSVQTERTEMKPGETLLMFGGTYLGALFQVATLALLMAVSHFNGSNIGAVNGALFGFIVSDGIGAFSSLSHRMFGHPNGRVYQSIKVWLIEVGQDVLCLTVAGAILGAWS